MTEKFFFNKQTGKSEFYLADTCWSAFTNASLAEWTSYVKLRKAQGFNAIQLNLLRQWDASATEEPFEPFTVVQREGEKYWYDYTEPNPAYFKQVREMLRILVEAEMQPVLVLLWANYVEGTWTDPLKKNNSMPLAQVAPYIRFAVEQVEAFDPIYFISGDTDFEDERTVTYYTMAFETLGEVAPQAVKSFHIRGRLAEIPAHFEERTDFFSYQSGHNAQFQAKSYQIPLELRARGMTKPIVNTEPCYEQISYSRNQYGRFSREDCRRSAWQSVLAGASAGVTYGAHGIWSWHQEGAKFGLVEGEGFDAPFTFEEALTFAGATDYGYLKKIVDQYGLIDCQGLSQSLKPSEELRVASYAKGYVLYVPYTTKLDLNQLFAAATTPYRVTGFDLGQQKEIDVVVEQGYIAQANVQQDSVYIVEMEDATHG